MNKSVVCYGGSMSDKDSSDVRPFLHHQGVGTLPQRIKDGRLLDASERHEGPGQDRKDPDSLNMSNLPIMYLLLLLLGFQAPQAQGRPFTTYQLNQYLAKIDEIMKIFNKLPLPSQVSNWDKVGIG